MQVQDPLAYLAQIASFSAIGAALAMLPAFSTAFGQGRIAAQAIESIARQPESRGTVQTTMFIGLAMAETGGIYGLLIAIIMLFANPLISQFRSVAGL